MHTVDQNGPAAAVGLTVSAHHFGWMAANVLPSLTPASNPTHSMLQVGELLLEVNGRDVQYATHKDVAQIILQGSSSTTLKTLVKTPEAAIQAEGSAGDSHTTQQ